MLRKLLPTNVSELRVRWNCWASQIASHERQTLLSCRRVNKVLALLRVGYGGIVGLRKLLPTNVRRFRLADG